MTAVPEAGGLEGRYSDPNHPVGFRTLVLSQDDPGMVVIAGNDNGPSGVEWTLTRWQRELLWLSLSGAPQHNIPNGRPEGF